MHYITDVESVARGNLRNELRNEERRSKLAAFFVAVAWLWSNRNEVITFRIEHSMNGRPCFIAEQMSITLPFDVVAKRVADCDDLLEASIPPYVEIDGQCYARVGEANGGNEYVWCGPMSDVYANAFKRGELMYTQGNVPPDDLL